MRTQAERDEQTVTIATALGLFVGIVAIGVTVVAVVGSTSDAWADTVLKATALVGVVVSTVYLARHRRG